jgi:hypothetical protein
MDINIGLILGIILFPILVIAIVVFIVVWFIAIYIVLNLFTFIPVISKLTKWIDRKISI